MTELRDETGHEHEGLVGKATERAQDAASVAHEKASELTAEGTTRLRDQIDTRSTQVGSQARSLARSLRSSSESLRSEGNRGAANVTEQAAQRIERVGGYLEQKSGDEVLRDIENFARRRPWMIAGLGLLGGIAVSRFVKASSEQRSSSQRGPAGEWPARGHRYGGQLAGGSGERQLTGEHSRSEA